MQTLFGTDGIRARIGTSPLTPTELVHLGAALGKWFCTKKPGAHILIAHDTRYSAPFIKAALKTGLLQHPVTLHDAHVLPTPALFWQVMHEPYEYGIMITASHNPYQDNGIKIITKQNGKLTQEEENEIYNLFMYPTEAVSYESLGQEQEATAGALSTYCAGLVAQFPADFLRGVKLVIDCAHGAYAHFAPEILRTLGAEVIALGTEPDGKNINKECGSLHPALVQQAVITHKAHAGFACDGDGDRLVAVTHTGTIKDGDELIAFLLNHPAYQHETNIVGTILSNQAYELHLAHQGKQLHRTPVGDKQVVEKMKRCNSLLGGEPSGHLILRDFTATSDALYTLLRVVQTAQLTNNWNLSSFTKFPQASISLPVTKRTDLAIEPYATIIAEHESRLAQGRVIVRYSGTEPVLRIVVETAEREEAYQTGKLLSEALSQAFTKEV